MHAGGAPGQDLYIEPVTLTAASSVTAKDVTFATDGAIGPTTVGGTYLATGSTTVVGSI